MAKINKIKKKKGRKIMKIKLSKNQQYYYTKRVEKEIEDIKKKYFWRGETTFELEDQYIIHRKLVITSLKFSIRDILYDLLSESDIFSNKECNELLELIDSIRDKIAEADNKLKDIYEAMIRRKRWEKWHFRDLTNQDS